MLLFGVPSPGLFYKGRSNYSRGLMFLSFSRERGYSIYLLARPVAPRGTLSEAFLLRPAYGFLLGTYGGFLVSLASLRFNCYLSSYYSLSNSLTISDNSFIY